MRVLDDWLSAYGEYTEESEAPPLFHFWTGVSVIASVLRRKVFLSQYKFEWLPNFYIVLVAPPGVVSKTTTINQGKRLLKQVKGIHFGPNICTWQSLVEKFEEATEAYNISATRHSKTDLFDVKGKYEKMSALSIFAGELGNFLDPQDKKAIDLLVTLWDAEKDSFKKSTRTQGEACLVNPIMNMIGCTTPGWIEDNIPLYMAKGGLSSRIIWLYAERKAKIIPYVEEGNIEQYEKLEKALVHDLQEMAKLQGKFTLSPEAKELGIEWYTRDAERLMEKGRKASVHDARRQTLIHKLAMIKSVSRSEKLIISREDMDFSIKMIEGIQEHTSRVFEHVGSEGFSKKLVVLEDTLKAYGELEIRKAYNLTMHKVGSIKDFEVLVESLVRSQKIKTTNKQGVIRLKWVA